jgi:hypothetical protein
MAKSRKPTPETSKISHVVPLAYARRQKTSGGGDAKEPDEPDDKTEARAEPAEAKPTDPPSQDATRPESRPTQESAAIDVPRAEPWPDATPTPMRPVESARAHTETIGMPAELVIGPPPALPQDPNSVEDPTSMPGPRDVPTGDPSDPAPPPGRVPSGDSRSLRKDDQFALVYRVQTAVISRFGTVGTRGQWRVVEYPTTASASNAYAKECSRFVSEGFSDYRD